MSLVQIELTSCVSLTPPPPGVEEPMKRLQPCLYQFVKDKMLKGEEPSPDNKKEVVHKFLAEFVSSVETTMVCVCVC